MTGTVVFALAVAAALAVGLAVAGGVTGRTAALTGAATGDTKGETEEGDCEKSHGATPWFVVAYIRYVVYEVNQ